MTPQEHLSKIDAIASRPILSDPAHRATFYTRLIAQFTRQQNLITKGKVQPYNLADLNWLISELEFRIKQTKGLQNDRD
jgi:hypothetical protein